MPLALRIHIWILSLYLWCPVTRGSSRVQGEANIDRMRVETQDRIQQNHRMQRILDEESALFATLQQEFHYGDKYISIHRKAHPTQKVFLVDFNTYYPHVVLSAISAACRRTSSLTRALQLTVKSVCRHIKKNRNSVLSRCYGNGLPEEDTRGQAVINPCPCGIQMHRLCFEACKRNRLSTCPNSFCSYKLQWAEETFYQRGEACSETPQNELYRHADCPLCLEALYEEKRDDTSTELKAREAPKASCWPKVGWSCSSYRFYFQNRRIL